MLSFVCCIAKRTSNIHERKPSVAATAAVTEANTLQPSGGGEEEDAEDVPIVVRKRKFMEREIVAAVSSPNESDEDMPIVRAKTNHPPFRLSTAPHPSGVTPHTNVVVVVDDDDDDDSGDDENIPIVARNRMNAADIEDEDEDDDDENTPISHMN